MTTSTMTITVTTPFTVEDLDRLRALLSELQHAGRQAEADVLTRLHAALYEAIYAAVFDEDEHDEVFARAMEEADRDFAAGRWTRDEEVMRRLAELSNG